jgi:HD-like signal output (HDOD) protein
VTEPTPPVELPPATPCLMAPLRDLAAWVRYFNQTEIPVLLATAAGIARLREREDDVEPSELAAIIQRDPLMTIKFMAYVASLRGKRDDDTTETETVISGLIMTGVGPFFRHFGPQPTVQHRLQDQPKALELLMELLHRAQRGAQFAMAFAVHRGDTDVEVIYQAAYLHDFAEMLMLCHAPTLALEIHAHQQANPTLRSASMQRLTYNIELDDLRQALMTLWQLPSLLVRISDGKHADHPAVLNVMLAVRVARHTMHGWDNAALPDDIEDIAKLLNAAPRVVLPFLHKVDLPI